MNNALQRSLVAGAAMLAIVLAMGAWASHGTRSANAGGDPLAAVQGFIDAVNAADADAMVASFTEDGYFADIDGGSFGLFGQPALEVGFGDIGVEGISVTTTSSMVSGTTVTGSIEFVDNIVRASGVQRVVQPFTAEVVGGKIASLVLTYDESDAQTATYLDYQAANEEEDEGPDPAHSVEVRMTGHQTGDDSGGFVGDFGGGVVGVFVGIEPGPAGVWQPSGIHEGTCDDLGELAQRLAVVVDGGAGSFISMDYDHLLDEPHAIAVAAEAPAEGEAPDVVACGNIERAAEPTEAAPTATPRVVLPNTGSGSGAADSSWLIVALVAAGAAGIAGMGALRLRARR